VLKMMFPFPIKIQAVGGSIHLFNENNQFKTNFSSCFEVKLFVIHLIKGGRSS